MPTKYGNPISTIRGCGIQYDQWVIGTTYSGIEDQPYADQVRNGSVVFQCIESHTSTAADEPGVGVNWETYWDISYSHFTKDITRYPEGSTYTDFLSPTGEKVRGYCWKLCPFSLEWRSQYAENGYYRATISGSYQFFSVPIEEQTLHTTTNGHMRGLGKQFICDDPACWYYTSHPTNSGIKFIIG